jgi:phosphoribosylamine--glycine ligase
MKSDLVPYLEASAEGNLRSLDPIKWEGGSAVCVVMTSGGYPNAYERGKVIHGLNDVMKMKDIMVFHAGTEKQDESIVTSGGRVLGITALGRDTQDAVERVYKAIRLVRFEGAHYRKDIGNKALGYLRGL